MESIIELITNKNEKTSYENTKQIASESELSDAYFKNIDDFAALLDNSNSYVRTRAFILICSQSRWDKSGKIKSVLPKTFPLLDDPKPTVVRQCISANLLNIKTDIAGIRH